MLRSTPLQALQALSTVLLPSPCRLCGNLLAELTAAPICSSCWNHLHPQSGSLCSRCGEGLGIEFTPSPETPETLCNACRATEPPFQLAVAWGAYQDELRELLHLLKFSRIEPIAPRLSALLASRILAIPDLPSSLLVVPVPLHRSRKRHRGFNQAEHLARSLVRSLRQQRPQMKLQLAPGALVRTRATETQAGLSPHQRLINVRGAFIAAGKRAQSTIRGRHILLVDDIYTTGATARACAQALLRANAASVHVATVARAQRHEVLHGQVHFNASEVVAATAFQPELPMHEDVALWETAAIHNG